MKDAGVLGWETGEVSMRGAGVGGLFVVALGKRALTMTEGWWSFVKHLGGDFDAKRVEADFTRGVLSTDDCCTVVTMVGEID